MRVFLAMIYVLMILTKIISVGVWKEIWKGTFQGHAVPGIAAFSLLWSPLVTLSSPHSMFG